MAISKNKKASNGWFILAVIFALTAAITVFFVLDAASKETTYYVVNQDIPARTNITEDLLYPMVTKAGSQPPNTLRLEEIRAGGVYSRFNLIAGDVLSYSNAGELSPVNEGIPEGFVTASFVVAPEDAVAGRVDRHDYIDIISSTETELGLTTKFVLRRVFVLDVNSGVSRDSGADSEAARTGATTLYTVAVSPQDAATLALLRDSPLYVVLTPADVVKNGVNDSNAIISSQADIFDFTRPAHDSGAGTSPDVGGVAVDSDVVDNGSIGEDTSTATPEAPLPEEKPFDSEEEQVVVEE